MKIVKETLVVACETDEEIEHPYGKILYNNKYKLFTQISLLEKERNYDTILDIIKETYIKDTNFWNHYI